MIVLIEIEELIPLLMAVAAEETDSQDIPDLLDLLPATYLVVNQLLENNLGLDNHPDIADGAQYAMEISGFSSALPRISEAIQALIKAIYPNGVVVSAEIMNRYGTIALTINPRGKPNDRYRSLV